MTVHARLEAASGHVLQLHRYYFIVEIENGRTSEFPDLTVI